MLRTSLTSWKDTVGQCDNANFSRPIDFNSLKSTFHIVPFIFYTHLLLLLYAYRFLSFDYRRKRKSERRDEWKHNNELSSRGRPLLARKESAAFIKHRQNDISVSLFSFRDFNESNQRAARGGWGRGVFHRVRRFNSPGRVLRARATLESGLTLLEDPRLGYDRPAFDVCALAHARAITRGDTQEYTRVHERRRRMRMRKKETERRQISISCLSRPFSLSRCSFSLDP